jgi:hypothetical protein
MKASGKGAYYHVVSRTVGGEFYLGDVEKERLLQVIRTYAQLYSTLTVLQKYVWNFVMLWTH